MKKILLPLCLVALLFCSCDDEDDNGKSNGANASKIDKLVYDIMHDYYLWNEWMPTYKKGENRDPNEYFETLLYSYEDKWSYISDDSDAENAELAGTPYSMGYSPKFYAYTKDNDVFILVEYVYPGTPAEKAGLKRGDIIFTINGESINADNYIDLYYAESATFGLGKIDFSVEPWKVTLTEETLKAKAEIINADPSVYDTIFYVNEKPVGYYVFTQFNIGTRCTESMDVIFDRFKSAGVKDLILDLRYNGGGSLTTAEHLASAIAPANVANGKNVFFKYVYNNILNDYYNQNGGEANFVVNMPENEHNADMENLYVLCTENTASASELVTCGLMPYMNVKLIGTNTHGKYCGMISFDKNVIKELENWFLCPICFKYANSVGLTDFKYGLEPDYVVEEDITNMLPFGDTNDPMLATALDVIGAQPLTAKSARRLPDGITVMGRNKSIVRNNLIVNGTLK